VATSYRAATESHGISVLDASLALKDTREEEVANMITHNELELVPRGHCSRLIGTGAEGPGFFRRNDIHWARHCLCESGNGGIDVQTNPALKSMIHVDTTRYLVVAV